MGLDSILFSRKPICLVGLMGSGKSAVGESLARRLNAPFCDSDHEIERESGKTIPEIFQERGESGFRLLEKQMILGLLDRSLGVLSIGGGAFVQEPVRSALLERTECIYLKTIPETIYQRIKGFTHRPLLQNEDPLGTLKKLLIEREPFYLQSPTVIETENKSVEEIVIEILAKF